MGTKETGLLVPFLCVFRGLWFYFKMQIQPQSNRHKEEKTLEPRALAKIRNGRAGTEIMPAPVCHAESRGRGDNTYVAFCWRTTGFVGYFSITPQSCSVGKRSILWFDTASIFDRRGKTSVFGLVINEPVVQYQVNGFLPMNSLRIKIWQISRLRSTNRPSHNQSSVKV